MIFKEETDTLLHLVKDFEFYKELGYSDAASVERLQMEDHLHDLFTSAYGADFYDDEDIYRICSEYYVEKKESSIEGILHKELDGVISPASIERIMELI